MTDRNQREFYRVDYPSKERPTLIIGEQEFQVVECSETGLRYELRKTDTPPAIFLTETKIPFKIIVSEQKYLRAHYLTRGR